jgi:pimeloyl-ACP methyl ester carboxylesterase
VHVTNPAVEALAGVQPRVPADRGDEVTETVLALPERYLPARAPALPRRYRVTVAGGGSWSVVADGPRCLVAPAARGTADAELVTDAETWLGVARGQQTGLEAFFNGRLRVLGDLNEALRLETLFRPPAGTPAEVVHGELNLLEVAEGLAIDVFTAGDPAAPPVLMIHGLGASKVSLLPAIAGLARTRRVIALDLPGFGKSTAPAWGRYDARWMAESAAAALDLLEVDRAAVVGNSLGGRVAVELALTDPERVTGLGLLCPAVAFNEYRLVRPLLQALRAEVALAASPWPLGGGVPRRVVDTGLRAMFADPGRVPRANLDAARDDFLRIMAHRSNRLAFLATARRLGGEVPRRFWPRLTELAVPSLWIFGDTDRLVSSGYARQVERTVPDAVVEVWRSCGHVPQFEHPRRTVARLDGFLPT